MINIYSLAFSIIIFSELLIIIAFLKPIREPYYIRDLWYNLQDSASVPSKALVVALTCLFLNTFMDMSWEKSYHGNLLDEVKDINLVLEFYLPKMSISYTCFFIVLFLFMLIERIFQYLIVIARLLEFELMCRHAILTRDNTSQVYRTVLILTNLYETANKKKQTDEATKLHQGIRMQ